jgi:ATP-dependent DNA helicase RecG
LIREEQSLYPPAAVREGLVNAFAHRDYADFRGGIAVHLYPDRLEIWSSGAFPEGVTPQTLVQGHISILRNPDIAHVLYLRGLMEKLGRGGVLILNACETHGLPPPRWQADSLGVTLTLLAPEVTPEVAPEVRAMLETVTGDMTRRELQERLKLTLIWAKR